MGEADDTCFAVSDDGSADCSDVIEKSGTKFT